MANPHDRGRLRSRGGHRGKTGAGFDNHAALSVSDAERCHDQYEDSRKHRWQRHRNVDQVERELDAIKRKAEAAHPPAS